MTTEQIQYFLVTARLLNMTEAARTLFVAQPTLSRQISLLEQELEVSLFSRDKGKLQLTKSGEYVAEQFKDIYGMLHHTIDTAKTIPSEEQTSVSIGILEGHFHDIGLIPSLKRFSEQYQDVDFTVEFRMAGELQSALINHRLDVLLGEKDMLCGTVLTDDTFEFCHLGTRRQKILMSTKHPLAGKEVLTEDDVSSLSFTIPASISLESFYRTDRTWLPGNAKVSKVAASYDAQMAYVATNRAVAIAYEDPELTQSEMGFCLKDFVGSYEKEIVLCYRKEDDNPAIPQLIGCFEPI